MTKHKCPYCECDEQDRCYDCGTRIPDHEYAGQCHKCYAATRQRWRDQDALARQERLEQLKASGRPMCSARLRNNPGKGQPCVQRPMTGLDVCRSHATPEQVAAANYGRELGDMGADDALALELLAGHPLAGLADVNRRERIIRNTAARQTQLIDLAAKREIAEL